MNQKKLVVKDMKNIYSLHSENDTFRLVMKDFSTLIEKTIFEIKDVAGDRLPKDDLIHTFCKKNQVDVDLIRKIGGLIPFELKSV